MSAFGTVQVDAFAETERKLLFGAYMGRAEYTPTDYVPTMDDLEAVEYCCAHVVVGDLNCSDNDIQWCLGVAYGSKCTNRCKKVLDYLWSLEDPEARQKFIEDLI